MTKSGWKVPAFAVTAALAVAVAGCGDNSVDEAVQSNEPEQGAATSDVTVPAPDSVKSAGKLTTCMDVAFPPMEFYEGSDTKTPVGFDVDLMSAVAGAMGVEAKVNPTSFDGLLPSLSSGRCDVVASGLFVTDERTKTFPAVPYLRSSRVLLVKKGNPAGIKSPEDLAGKTVATQSGTEYAKSLRKLNAEFSAAGKSEFRLQTYPKASDAVQQVVVGRADAALTQDTEAAYRISTQPDSFEVGYRYDATDVFGAYHRMEDTQLGEALESALTKLRDDGTLAKLAAKYELPEEGVQP
jgi:polar amino acid transport system substrate-binding protein